MSKSQPPLPIYGHYQPSIPSWHPKVLSLLLQPPTKPSASDAPLQSHYSSSSSELYSSSKLGVRAWPEVNLISSCSCINLIVSLSFNFSVDFVHVGLARLYYYPIFTGLTSFWDPWLLRIESSTSFFLFDLSHDFFLFAWAFLSFTSSYVLVVTGFALSLGAILGSSFPDLGSIS